MDRQTRARAANPPRQGGCSAPAGDLYWQGGPGQSCSSKKQFQLSSNGLGRLGFGRLTEMEKGEAGCGCCAVSALQRRCPDTKTPLNSPSQFSPLQSSPVSNVTSISCLSLSETEITTSTGSGSGRTLRPSVTARNRRIQNPRFVTS